MTKLTRYEFRLFLRDPGATIAALVLPVGMIAFLGAIGRPSAGDDSLESFFPVAAIALGVGQLGLNMLPTSLAGYREKGILRRMAATPVPPIRLLAAQLAVGAVVAVVSTAAVVATGVLGFGFDVPAALPAFLTVLALGLLSIFATGMVIAAVAPSARVATGAGVLLFFVSIAVGGVFLPVESMPPFLASLADYTPLGAFVHALRASWEGTWPQPVHLAVMAVCAVACSLFSARMFRWD